MYVNTLFSIDMMDTLLVRSDGSPYFLDLTDPCCLDLTDTFLSRSDRYLPCCSDLTDTFLVDITSEEENQFLSEVTNEKFWTAGKQSKQVGASSLFYFA